MKLTRSQRRSLRGEVKCIEEYRIHGRWPETGYIVCTHPSAIVFMKRCGLVKDPLWHCASLTREGRSYLI